MMITTILVVIISITNAVPSHGQKSSISLDEQKNLKNKSSFVSNRFVDHLNPKHHYEPNVGIILNDEDVMELYIEQKLDHFSTITTNPSLLPRTFQQRYFYTSRFVSKEKEIEGEMWMTQSSLRGRKTSEEEEEEEDSKNETYAFLCVGGEGPSLDKSVLVDSVHCTGDMIELARKLHEEGASVHLFAIEHRYYGSSFPEFPSKTEEEQSSPVTNQNLRFLSSRQALSDIAHFIDTMNRYHHHHQKMKWITFGGSYPGMLSTWSRTKFPHLVHGAVGNSAPIQALLRYYQYNDHVDKVLGGGGGVGGNEECRRIVRDGHEEIARLLLGGEEEKRKMVADLFGICGGEDAFLEERNVQVFLGDGVISVPAQGNDPSCEEDLCNIEKLCQALIEEDKKSASPMRTLAAINKRQQGYDPEETTNDSSCINIEWNKEIQYLSSTSNPSIYNTRSWLWQTCTEFGFYQTCPNANDTTLSSSSSSSSPSCPFGRGYHLIDMDIEICQKAFSIGKEQESTMEIVQSNIRDTLEYYGGWDIRDTASRVLSVNGDVDPWSELAMTTTTAGIGTQEEEFGVGGGGPTMFWVKGASHHFWTHAVKDSDSDEIVKAREMIHNQVKSWLRQE